MSDLDRARETVCPIGENRGRRLAELDVRALEWLTRVARSSWLAQASRRVADDKIQEVGDYDEGELQAWEGARR